MGFVHMETITTKRLYLQSYFDITFWHLLLVNRVEDHLTGLFGQVHLHR
jgi:hypothetical protein